MITEFLIVMPSGTRSTQIVEFKPGTKRTDIVRTAQQMLRTSGWKKVKVGIGEYWSNWIY